MQIFDEDTDKTKPILVFIVIVAVIFGASYLFTRILNLQSEEKIRLAKQGDENLNEYIVTGTNHKVTIPPAESGNSNELIPSSANNIETEQNEDQQGTTTSGSQQQTAVTEERRTPPGMILDEKLSYKAELTTTEGKIVIELNAKQTPKTVNNFVYLAKRFFYDGTIFHRVVKGFMIQGGDPTGTGAGGPGYRFADEPFEGEYSRGTVAMANAGPNTNGSQFFIMHEDNPLPKNYVIFGKVVDGMDVVDKIANAPVTTAASGENSKPLEPTKIRFIDIIETPIEE